MRSSSISSSAGGRRHLLQERLLHGLVRTDEPVTRWHWGSVIEKGCVFDDDRVTLTIPMYDREWSHWWAAEELGDPLTIIWVRVGHRRARMSKMTTMMPTATGRKRLSTAGPARPATSIGSAAGPSILRTRGRSASPVSSLSGVVAGSAAASSVSAESDSQESRCLSQVARQASC